MAYTPTNWENREVEKPRTYTMVTNADGTVTLTPSEGTVFTAGTPIEASLLNKMETQIAANDTNKVSKTGDTMSGTLNGTVIDVTDTLMEKGVRLDAKYQAKGSYQASGNYPTWSASSTGVVINMGKFGGTGKNVVMYLTSSQPAASSTEHRVWIQIDNF